MTPQASHLKLYSFQDFSGGPVVKSLPANAGDTGLIPGLRKSTCLRATNLLFHNYWAHTPIDCALQPKKPPQREAWSPQLESSPYSMQLEKACTQQWRPSAAKH